MPMIRFLLLALPLCLGGCVESQPDVTELTIGDVQAQFDSGELIEIAHAFEQVTRSRRAPGH